MSFSIYGAFPTLQPEKASTRTVFADLSTDLRYNVGREMNFNKET